MQGNTVKKSQKINETCILKFETMHALIFNLKTAVTDDLQYVLLNQKRRTQNIKVP